MDHALRSKLSVEHAHYDANYRNFQTTLYEEIRRDAFGDDIGQNSWLTSSELDSIRTWLELAPGKTLLDVACGAGGPALRIADFTGCAVIGVDVHEQAIASANELAAQRGLARLADFRILDAGNNLPFPDDRFDAIMCIDAINHFPDRGHLIAEWSRLLTYGGRLVFTDPIVITGPLTDAEIAARTSAGFYLLVPEGYDEQVIAQSGLRLLSTEDITGNMAKIAESRRAARALRELALRGIEGDETYEREQEFLRIACLVARERRLSRFVFVAEKVT